MDGSPGELDRRVLSTLYVFFEVLSVGRWVGQKNIYSLRKCCVICSTCIVCGQRELNDYTVTIEVTLRGRWVVDKKYLLEKRCDVYEE